MAENFSRSHPEPPKNMPSDQADRIAAIVADIGRVARPIGGNRLGLGWVPQYDENGTEVPPEDMIPPVTWWAAMHIPGPRGTVKFKCDSHDPEQALSDLLAKVTTYALNNKPPAGPGSKKKRKGWWRAGS